MVRRIFSSGAVILAGILFASVAIAAGIDFLPADQSVGINDTVLVDILVSDLGAGAPPSLGGFNFGIGYDNAVLTPVQVAFGVSLGDPTLLEAITVSDLSLAGSVEVFVVSLLLPGDLDALQADSFRLLTLEFLAVGGGVSPLLFSQPMLTDAVGGPLAVVAGTGRIAVNIIPEPATFQLLGLGLVAVSWALWRRRQS